MMASGCSSPAIPIRNLIQAKNQARNLSDFLGHAVGSAVTVKPMLTFPAGS